MLANKGKKAIKKKTKDKYLCAFFLVYMVVLFRITVFRSNFSLFHVMENGFCSCTCLWAILSGLFHWDACFWLPVR